MRRSERSCSVAVMVNVCTRTSCSILTYITAGVKAALVQKLCKDEERRRNPDRANQKLTDYLTPTAQVAPAIKPTLNAFYFEHFNMVDKFDAMLGHIPVAFKVTRPELRLFLASIQTALCNTYVLYEDLVTQLSGDPDEQLRLRQFAKDLADELDQ